MNLSCLPSLRAGAKLIVVALNMKACLSSEACVREVSYLFCDEADSCRYVHSLYFGIAIEDLTS